MASPRRMRIYKSRLHLLATILIVVLPFLFFFLFSKLAAITSGKLFLNILVSFERIFIAYVLALFLGWLLAVLFYKGRRSEVALPVFDVLQSFPTFAALPLVTYFWGPSGLTVVIFLIVTIIWPIFFSVISSLKLVRRDWEEAVEIAGLRKLDYLVHFLIPITVPGLITGSIVGLGEGWEALVATEVIVGIKSGLGSFFKFFADNPTITIFGIFGFLLLIFSINKLIWLPLLDWSHRKMGE